MENIDCEFTINGRPEELSVAPNRTLLHMLREDFMLTGVREGCGHGECGSCNVIMDGRLVNTCCVLAVEAMDSDISTIEGLAGPSGLHPLQEKFLEHAALQCGVCTPGFLVSAKALLDTNPNPTEHDVRWWLAGNLCRCTGYDKIVRAVLDAAATMQGKS